MSLANPFASSHSLLFLGQWIALVGFPRAITVTSPTVAHSMPDTDVLATKRVAISAMRLTRTLRCKRISAQRVLSMRHKLKMIGCNARRIAAQMINFAAARPPLRERADPQFVSEPMYPVLMAVNDKGTVSTAAVPIGASSSPQPTPIRLWRNGRQESCQRLGVHTISIQEGPSHFKL